MKKDIQPQVYIDTVVTCACGNKFTTISTKKAISVEICSACHPFFTGTQKLVDTEGRIQKFTKKQKVAAEKQSQIAARKVAKAQKGATKSTQDATKTLKDLLQETKTSIK